MFKLFKLTEYHLIILLKNIKTLCILLAWLIIAVVVYQTNSNGSVEKVVTIGIILFLVMVVLTIMYFYMESEDGRNIMVLNSNNLFLYHLSDLTALWIGGLCFSFIGIIVSFVCELCCKANGYESSILGCFIVYSMYALLGVSMGSLFHPRIIKNKVHTIFIVIVLGLASIAKNQIADDRPVLKYFLKIAPPVAEIRDLFGDKTNFGIANIGYAQIYFWIYFIILFVIYMLLIVEEKY